MELSNIGKTKATSVVASILLRLVVEKKGEMLAKWGPRGSQFLALRTEGGICWWDVEVKLVDSLWVLKETNSLKVGQWHEMGLKM